MKPKLRWPLDVSLCLPSPQDALRTKPQGCCKAEWAGAIQQLISLLLSSETPAQNPLALWPGNSFKLKSRLWKDEHLWQIIPWLKDRDSRLRNRCEITQVKPLGNPNLTGKKTKRLFKLLISTSFNYRKLCAITLTTIPGILQVKHLTQQELKFSQLAACR